MKRIGKQTFEIEGDCFIIGRDAIVGEKEKNGTFGKYIKHYVTDDKMGEKTFEKAERKMLSEIIRLTLQNAKISEKEIDLYLSGDLTNQLVTSNYVAEQLQIPFVGIYSACSTITACLAVGASLMETGAFNNILCSSISHFSSAERQYRYPLEFGNQRQSYSQWTVTAGGGFVLSNKKSKIRISKVCFSKVQDYGIVDIANMGAAMAPDIDIIGPCGMILPRISNTKFIKKEVNLVSTMYVKYENKSANFADFFSYFIFIHNLDYLINSQ